MLRESTILLLLVGTVGCKSHRVSETLDRPKSVVSQRVPVTLAYTVNIPSHIPRVLEIPEKDGSTTTAIGREAYASGYRDGWYECFDGFMAGEFSLSGLGAKPSGGAESSWSADARAEGFAQCLAALRRMARGDEAALRAALRPPTWYERVEHYVDADVRRQRRDAGGAEPEWRIALDDPRSREAALALLLRTETFTSTAVGDPWMTPMQVRAFRLLLDQPDAAEVFADLLRRGQVAGQLFSLCGLYLTDHDLFAQTVQPFRTDARRVGFFAGCINDERPVHELVESRAENTIRLRPGQTWAEGFEESAAQHGENAGVSIDIIGGGWPHAFKTAHLDAEARRVAGDQD